MKLEEIKKMYELEKSHWWFTGKRSLVIQIFKRYGKKGKWLDIGCGTGFNLKEFQRFSEVTGCDISDESLLFCKKRGIKNLVKCSATKLKFENDVFDVITALDLLEHIENDTLAIKEVYRVLKKDGVFILTVPAWRFLWTKHDEIFHHKRRYSKKELVSKIKSVGFKIEKISYWNFLMFPLSALYKILSKKSNIQKTSKPLNFLFHKFILFDNFLFRYFDLPYGTSLVTVCKK